ncbi:gem-associated protein 4-like isoform X2 [Haliotis cracherodii]|uniref:gem-associated protein 4-like isoform X2 n=1 Tax=Haliotis cracherodii TaxID=6455 RepID=UPI0039E82F60
MEFCAELAVFQSAAKFATLEFPSPADITDSDEVQKFTDLISPSVREILDGLDSERSLLDRNVWNFKLLSFLLTHILKNSHNKDQQVDAVKENGASNSNDRSLDKAETPTVTDNKGSRSADHIFQHFPCLNLAILFELVKRFKWNGQLLECLQVLDESQAAIVVKSIIEEVKSSDDPNNLELVVTCQKYLFWLVIKSANQNQGQLNVAMTMEDTVNWFHKHLNRINQQELQSKGLFIEIIHILVILGGVCHNKISITELKTLLLQSEQGKDKTVVHRETTRILGLLNKSRTRQDCENNFSELLQRIHKGFPKLTWLEVSASFLKDFNSEGESQSGRNAALMEDLARETTLDLGIMDLNVISFYERLFETTKTDSSGDTRISTVHQFLASFESHRCHQMALKQKEEEERQGKITLEEILFGRLAGFEAHITRIVTCCDPARWRNERYTYLLRENCDLLFSESDIQALLQTLRTLIRVECQGLSLAPVLQILLDAFSRLPILTQEKIILENFLSCDDPDLLSSVGSFHQEMNITFNQFTSETSEKDLRAVLRLSLVDPVALVEYAVTVAVKSSGQIPVVLKIFNSVPDLCRCCYGNHQPEKSLLCHVITQYLLVNKLDRNEEKNLIKFISTAVQSFHREVNGYTFEEAAILPPAEFASAAILPFIGSCNSGDQEQPINTELALRLFICVLERSDKDCDWLIELQPQTLLLCLFELLDDCVELWDGRVNKSGIKQSCLRCLQLMQAKCAGIFSKLHVMAADWLKSKTKDLDWTVLVHLQKTLSCLDTTQAAGHQFVEDLADHVIRGCADNCLPLLRCASVSDETATAINQRIPSGHRVISPDVLTSALSQMLRNLLLMEWRRVSGCLWTLITHDCLTPPYRLLLDNKVVLATRNEVKCLLTLTQILSNVVMATSSDMSAPASAVQHVNTCYVTVLQEQTKVLTAVQDRKIVSFILIQMLSHVTVAMTTMDSDQSEPLYVFLLDLLGKYSDLKKGRQSPSNILKFRELDQVVVQAVGLMEDNSRQETLLKKLFEKKQETGLQK